MLDVSPKATTCLELCFRMYYTPVHTMCEKGTLGNANCYYVPCSSQKTKVSKVSQKIVLRGPKVSNFLDAFVLEIKYVHVCYVVHSVLVWG